MNYIQLYYSIRKDYSMPKTKMSSFLGELLITSLQRQFLTRKLELIVMIKELHFKKLQVSMIESIFVFIILRVLI